MNNQLMFSSGRDKGSRIIVDKSEFDRNRSESNLGAEKILLLLKKNVSAVLRQNKYLINN